LSSWYRSQETRRVDKVLTDPRQNRMFEEAVLLLARRPEVGISAGLISLTVKAHSVNLGFFGGGVQ